ncbi:MAG: excinuclease ABC subunit B [Candidatus Kerfeldbacteria bacterium CG15_BIG_FIL_POST_REV_8_21_14_020_45_12]|uniref:UvrABC system protein B n=1 Tax=Candidatus Kerfeldbacteria bacterium CG15_BIG_FIL_POST_REV_8_21_14_020_45_12 TaxID=2014247 RepID=A0A2M7H325_9BACT|nr:MAG: excinuclease ABC subunit B [Candidatus Kerfeldbacteria bacterium CG15_BIG_FIL_POST_REV_8_21_14_020_45_12]PJA93313.1 MAG: excinuclease ABC subunit B [Candidatus Kerfeldbacteria bacterium CG_4_9_14_3_um_filter_45_8]
MPFELEAPFSPSGDQPSAIAGLVKAIKKGQEDMTLLGVTGSGKTFTIANVIQELQRPTLVISHNKTLAAQLASEFREFFPKAAVQYFVSYYDYYQPEAYMARSDTYIEKETDINEEIERLRHAATQSLLSRRDVIIVASVSCIYGLGSPKEYKAAAINVRLGGEMSRKQLLIKLVEMNFSRNDLDFHRGTFRVRGDVVEVFPTALEHTAYRFDFFGDDLESIKEVDTLTGEIINVPESVDIYPATLYLAQTDFYEQALQKIRSDLESRLSQFRKAGKVVEAQRLEQRTKFDLEMIENAGYVNGIENYSRYFDGRTEGEPPFTLIDYFPEDFLVVVDESHQTIPQIGAMYAGDRARKESLVEHGFRLPASFDNRPLQFAEFENKVKQVVYVSATPGPYEKKNSTVTVEQLIRPTGLTEPSITIRPTQGQIPDLLKEVEKCTTRGERVLVTTLTKRMAEELADYLNENGVKVQYLHSDVDTMERLEILRDLRLGVFDVLVGINLLREGLDLPEVSLVAILDADKEGFLRSETALVQTMGRAARHLHGRVILYADSITGSMQRAMDEVNRRRKAQEEYNLKNNITPQQILKRIRDDRLSGQKQEESETSLLDIKMIKELDELEFEHLLASTRGQMDLASQNLEFELAAKLRDQLVALEAARPKSVLGKQRAQTKTKRGRR